MAHTSRGFSRRTFLLGAGGGAASVSIVWGVSELGLPVFGPPADSPIAAGLDAHAEYDGWLVTTEEKAHLILVEFTDGWHRRESGARTSGVRHHCETPIRRRVWLVAPRSPRSGR